MNPAILNDLNAPSGAERVQRLRSLLETHPDLRDGTLSDEVNNHVHTRFSFSPYSPTQAAVMARVSGLRVVGSVDHDSIGAAEEMIEACKLLRIGSTVGFELRTGFHSTSLADKRLNNPDSIGIGYIVIHGVPRPCIDKVRSFLGPIQEARNKRNRRQVEAMNELLRPTGARPVPFTEVEGCSEVRNGGSITERHILFALARSLMRFTSPGRELRTWAEEHVTGVLPDRLKAFLDDPDNPHYVYDLLGALKSTFLPRFFIQPDGEECIPVERAVEFGNSINAIPAYAYLGDVGDSPTGDKKAQKFEDDYLDELFEVVAALGFRAVTYMPPRNTVPQLLRVQDRCRAYGLMEISGVDINSSRQEFTCPEILQPEFRHLIDTTWALVAHEKLTSSDPARSLFAGDGPLSDRVARYADLGRRLDPADPYTTGA